MIFSKCPLQAQLLNYRYLGKNDRLQKEECVKQINRFNSNKNIHLVLVEVVK